MSDQTFTRFVAFPSGKTGIRAKYLASCFKSLAKELESLDNIKVKGIRIEPTERKLVVTLEGTDPKRGEKQNE